jgi:hypothetical protein
MQTVPNLRNTFADRYRLALDPAADSWGDPWMHTIPTRTGTVFVHSPTHAGVEVQSRRWGVIGKLKAAGYPVHAQGDDVTTFLVPWDDLEAVLPLLRPYRRRQLSPAEKQRRTTQLLANQFPPTEASKIRHGKARSRPEAARRSIASRRPSRGAI